MFKINDILEDKREREQIGLELTERLTNIPKNVSVSIRKSLVDIEYGPVINIFNQSVHKLNITLSFRKSNISDSLYSVNMSVWRLRKKTLLYDMVRSESTIRRYKRDILILLKANGIRAKIYI